MEAEPQTQTAPAETVIGRELRLLAREADEKFSGVTTIRSSELDALADAFDHQAQTNGLLQDLSAGMKKAYLDELARHAEELGRKTLMIRLMRFYALNPVLLPDQDDVIAFLRSYIDDGRWLPIPWPTELPTCAKFIADCGFINQGGIVTPLGRTPPKGEAS